MSSFFHLVMRSGARILLLSALLVLLISVWVGASLSFQGGNLGMADHSPVSWEWADWLSFANTLLSGVINAGALLFYALVIDRADKFLSRRDAEAAE